MIAFMGFVAFCATYALTYEALTWPQALGASLLAQVVTFAVFYALEEM